MKSKSKKPLTITEIQQIIEASFGTTKLGLVMELTDGWFNTAYSIEIPDLGQEVVMKVAPPSEVKILTYEKNIMKTEVQVNKILKEKTDVPVPEILSYNFNQDIINRDYFIMEKLKGIPWNKIKSKLSQKQNDHLKYKTGVYAAQINSIIGNYFGYFTDLKKSYNKSWKNTFVNMIKNVLDDGIELNAKIPQSPKDIMKLIENNATVLEDVKVPQLVHWDLWEGNIFIIKQEQEKCSIEGIIDCERALWGDPLIEYEFMHAPSNQAFLEGFEAGTKEKFEFTNDLEQRRQLYNVYLFLIIIIEVNSRGYYGNEATKIIQWANFELQNNISHLEKK